ncbi:MAG: hypothetical protein R3362_05770 [Rhodothermales bacterium]|nr:hypothetical protein [Rhodothermales bacterium]
MYPALRPILNRGGAGFSMSRAETADVLSGLVRQHQILLNSYDAALRDLADRDLAAALEPEMVTLRTELSKIKELVYSNGGTPPNGTDLDPKTLRIGETDGEIVHALADLERAYRGTLQAEIDRANHQMRTYALIEALHQRTEDRIGILHPIVSRMPRHAARRDAERVPVDAETRVPADIGKTEDHATGTAASQPLIADDPAGRTEDRTA